MTAEYPSRASAVAKVGPGSLSPFAEAWLVGFVAVCAIGALISFPLRGQLFALLSIPATDTPPALQWAVRQYSFWGVVALLLCALACWAVFIFRERVALPYAALATVAGAAAYGTGLLLKALVREVRPCSAYQHPTVATCPTTDSWSWPSNHSVFSAAMMVVLIILAGRLWWLWMLMALTIGVSRVFLGVHYVHDVLSGFAIGAGITLLIWVLGLHFLGRRLAHAASNFAGRQHPRAP